MNWYQELLAKEELRTIARRKLRKYIRVTGRAMSVTEAREWIRIWVRKASR